MFSLLKRKSMGKETQFTTFKRKNIGSVSPCIKSLDFTSSYMSFKQLAICLQDKIWPTYRKEMNHVIIALMAQDGHSWLSSRYRLHNLPSSIIYTKALIGKCLFHPPKNWFLLLRMIRQPHCNELQLYLISIRTTIGRAISARV